MELMEFLAFATKQGWEPAEQVTILLNYIDNQKSPEAFRDYLDGIAEEEQHR